MENSCLSALLFVSHITSVPFISQMSQLLFQLSHVSLSARDKMKTVVGLPGLTHTHPSHWAVSISPGWHLPLRDGSAASPVNFCSPVPAGSRGSPQTQVFPVLLFGSTPQSYAGATETRFSLVSPEKAPTLKLTASPFHERFVP